MMNEDMKAKGIELGLNERGAYILSTEVEKAKRAVEDAFKELEKIQLALNDTDADRQLVALRSLAGHAGYSNSAVTACAELYTAAGAVAGILSTI